MEGINPKLLDALKQRNIQINFKLGAGRPNSASKTESLSVISSDSKGMDSDVASPSLRGDKIKTNRSTGASYDTDSLKVRKETSPTVNSRPVTAGGASGIFSSTMGSGFKIRPTSAKDMIDNFDSMSKTATSGFKRLKEGSKTMNGWKLNTFSSNTNIVEEEFEDEFLRDLDELNGQKLSEMLLVDESRLSAVKSLEVKVDLTYSSLNSAGEILSNLIELKLNGSIMKSLRDIGNAFQNLEILWVSNCGLKDLAGVNSFPQLKELYASYNSIEDVSDLMFKVSLNVIDLEGNDIKDAQNLQNLMGLEQLSTLSVAGNPFADKDPDFRKKIAEYLPQVKTIDDEKVEIIHASPSKRGKKNIEEPQQSEGQYEDIIEKMGKLEIMNRNELRQSVRDLLKNTEMEEPDEEALITMTVKKKHNKASSIETTAKRLRAKEISNPAIAENLTDKANKRPSTAKPTSKIPVKAQTSAQTNIFSAASDLTKASDEAFSGNPLKAMRHKRQNTFINSKHVGDEEKLTQKNIFDLFTEFAHYTRENDEVQDNVFEQDAQIEEVETTTTSSKMTLALTLNRTNSQKAVGENQPVEPSENPRRGFSLTRVRPKVLGGQQPILLKRFSRDSDTPVSSEPIINKQINEIKYVRPPRMKIRVIPKVKF